MNDKSQTNEPSANRTRLRTSTSASGGWAARLGARIGQGEALAAIQASTLARTAGSSRTASEALSSLRA